MTEHYNRPEQTNNRRSLRRNLSQSEALLWTALSGKKILGHKFRRQYSVDQYKIDFYCVALKLAIEVDGDQHQEHARREYDERRQAYIESYGIRFLRLPSIEVCMNLDGVVMRIIEVVEEIEKKRT